MLFMLFCYFVVSLRRRAILLFVLLLVLGGVLFCYFVVSLIGGVLYILLFMLFCYFVVIVLGGVLFCYLCYC